MALHDWPATLPAPMRQGYRESDIDTNVVDDNDFGIPALRATTTKIHQTFNFTLRCSDAEKAVLFTFHDTTVKKVEAFNWTHPITAVVYELQFNSRPQTVAQVALDIWDIAVSAREI